MNSHLFRLFRPKLALLNGVSAVAGGLLFPSAPEPAAMLATVTGVGLMAASGSVLNQVQERNFDLLMERTRLRPLPRKMLTPSAATVVGGICAVTGALVLASAGGVFPGLLGAAALAWYLGIYTPLKRHSELALAAGALCGAIPPVIGWTVAGGAPGDPRIMVLAGLMYLWQIPHFWLFQSRHEADYRRAGFVLSPCCGTTRSLLCMLWLLALLPAALLLPTFGIIDHPGAAWLIPFALAIAVAWLLRWNEAVFACLNLFPVILAGLLLARK